MVSRDARRASVSTGNRSVALRKRRLPGNFRADEKSAGGSQVLFVVVVRPGDASEPASPVVTKRIAKVDEPHTRVVSVSLELRAHERLLLIMLRARRRHPLDGRGGIDAKKALRQDGVQYARRRKRGCSGACATRCTNAPR